MVDEVRHGRMVMEGQELVDAGDELFRTRRRLMGQGTIMVSLALDEAGSILADPQLSTLGAVEADRFDNQRADLRAAISEAIEALSDVAARDDERVREAVRLALRQTLELPRQKRPILEIQITRLGAETLDALEDEESGIR